MVPIVVEIERLVSYLPELGRGLLSVLIRLEAVVLLSYDYAHVERFSLLSHRLSHPNLSATMVIVAISNPSSLVNHVPVKDQGEIESDCETKRPGKNPVILLILNAGSVSTAYCMGVPRENLWFR